MQTKDFDYYLPAKLIAQEPASDRAQARLMLVCRATGEINHYHAADLPSLLQNGDLMVLNDTRVIPARVFGKKQKTGGKVEVLFVEECEAPRGKPRGVFAKPSDLSSEAIRAKGEAKSVIPPCPDSVSGQSFRAKAGGKNVWQVFLHSSGRARVGDVFLLAKDKIAARVTSIGERGRAVLELRCAHDFLKILAEEGLPPLPPYIKRQKDSITSADDRQKQYDSERYQTVYARVPGAIAAPTAGLHLSNGLLAALERALIQRTEITLHVGPGTFVPVRCARVEDHKMESERFIISPPAAQKINQALAEKRRIVAVGTTVVRTLESAAFAEGKIAAGNGRTEIFIYPPFRFQAVGALLTNFHLPCSTLLMLVSAFAGRPACNAGRLPTSLREVLRAGSTAGRELIRHAYEIAVKEKYRFYSYGDCMLIV